MSETTKKNLHLGAELDADLAEKFRIRAGERKFKKKEILQRLVEWWISQDQAAQIEFYHGIPEERTGIKNGKKY